MNFGILQCSISLIVSIPMMVDDFTGISSPKAIGTITDNFIRDDKTDSSLLYWADEGAHEDQDNASSPATLDSIYLPVVEDDETLTAMPCGLTMSALPTTAVRQPEPAIATYQSTFVRADRLFGDDPLAGNSKYISPRLLSIVPSSMNPSTSVAIPPSLPFPMLQLASLQSDAGTDTRQSTRVEQRETEQLENASTSATRSVESQENRSSGKFSLSRRASIPKTLGYGGKTRVSLVINESGRALVETQAIVTREATPRVRIPLHHQQ